MLLKCAEAEEGREVIPGTGLLIRLNELLLRLLQELSLGWKGCAPVDWSVCVCMCGVHVCARMWCVCTCGCDVCVCAHGVCVCKWAHAYVLDNLCDLAQACVPADKGVCYGRLHFVCMFVWVSTKGRLPYIYSSVSVCPFKGVKERDSVAVVNLHSSCIDQLEWVIT